MIHIIKKWQVVIYFDSGKTFSFIIYDDHYSNMLRKLNEINFDYDPYRIDIIELKQKEQVGVYINEEKEKET